MYFCSQEVESNDCYEQLSTSNEPLSYNHSVNLNSDNLSRENDLAQENLTRSTAQITALKEKLAFISCQLKESKNLTKQLYSLKKTNSEEVDNKVLECLGGIFSQNQINIILKKNRKVKWTSNEISQAFTLRYLGVRGYKFVRQNMNFPLPGLSTLRSWATKIDLRHGLFKDVLRLMKVASIDMTKRDYLCVIQFDEV